MSFVLIINIALLISVFYISYINLFGSKNTVLTKKLHITAAVILSYFMIIGIIGTAVSLPVSWLGCFAFFISGAIIFALSFLLKKYNKNILNTLFKTLIFILALEVIIFNFNAYQLIFDDYEYAELKLEEAYLNNINTSGQTVGSGNVSIEFTDINRKIGTIKISAHSNNNKKIKIDIDYSDTTNRDYRNNVANAVVVNDCEESYTIPCNSSGEINKIRFHFTPDNNDTITIEGIEINTPIAFKFSLIRILAILIAVLLKYIFCNSSSFSKTLEENEKLCMQTARIITAVFIIIAFALMIFQRSDGLKDMHKDFEATGGNQITQEIVDAFENGQTSLLREVSPELEALDNPYDRSQRTGVDHAWDHLYYDGKYYSYYGIATVLLLFLPYHLITGHYFPSNWAVFIFGALGIFFLYKLYMTYMKEFFTKTKISLVLMGLIMTQLITGIWFCFPTPNFYEIAQTSGFMFCTAGFYFLSVSGVIGSRKISHPYLSLSSVMLALAVLSRPTLALYCICALIFIFAGFLKLKALPSDKNKSRTKSCITYLTAALVPYVVIGLVQMIYNFMRFGSPISFGIEYSLTINDFINAQYHNHMSGIGIYNYIAALPSFTCNFPFAEFNVETFYPNGYYFVANSTAIGLMWIAMPVFSYLYSKKAYLISQNENKKLYSIILFAVCIVAPFIIMASIWESGYAARYRVDFAWQILLGALTIAFIIYNNCKNEGVKTLLTKSFYISLIISFILNFAQIYTFTINLGGFNHADLDKWFCIFERAFEFWR